MRTSQPRPLVNTLFATFMFATASFADSFSTRFLVAAFSFAASLSCLALSLALSLFLPLLPVSAFPPRLEQRLEADAERARLFESDEPV